VRREACSNNPQPRWCSASAFVTVLAVPDRPCLWSFFLEYVFEEFIRFVASEWRFLVVEEQSSA
jgi:hypothetical protein